MYQLSHRTKQLADNSTPFWKDILYVFLRSWWDGKVVKSFGEHLPFGATRVIGERGYNVTYRRRWAVQGINVRSTTILVQGTGNGWDVVSWASLRPKRIIAVDLFKFDSWPEISEYCMKKYCTKVEFVASPLENNFGLNNSEIGLVVSDAVYEHCQNMVGVMTETYRVLCPGGRVYANYGPLWYCAGGDHFSGRDELINSYSHITNNQEQYQVYIASNRERGENFQDGARYIELGLFSKLCTFQYLEIYKKVGFEVEDLWLEISQRALDYRDSYPFEFNYILEQMKG